MNTDMKTKELRSMNTDTNTGIDKDSLYFKKSKDPKTNEHLFLYKQI